MDSVSHYDDAPTEQAAEKYTNASNADVDFGTGRDGRDAFGFFVGASRCDIDVPANATYFVSMALKFDDPANSAGRTDEILFFREGATTHISLSINRSMRLKVELGGTTVIADSGGVGLPTNTWMNLEMKVKVANAGGTVDVRLNGINILSFTGDTQNGGTASIDNIQFEGVANADMIFHDIIINDDTGGVNDSWMGDNQVDVLFPDGDGTTNNFTPLGAGANYVEVDETEHDSDTSYNEDATVNDVDLYTFANLPALPGTATVRGVQIVASVKSDDGGAKSLALIARPVSTNRIGATQSITSAYLFYREISDVSPETSSAWTETEIDGSEFGIEVAA
jgi:hypothetical protein